VLAEQVAQPQVALKVDQVAIAYSTQSQVLAVAVVLLVELLMLAVLEAVVVL
jgi:hypothetical protein